MAVRRAGLLLGLLALEGCAQPMVDYTLQVPAMVQSPVRLAGIVDERPRFRQLFCTLMRRDDPAAGGQCDRWLQRFADEAAALPVGTLAGRGRAFDVIIVSGIFGECLPTVQPFAEALRPLETAGYRVSYAPVKGRASSDFNAAILRAHINGRNAESGRQSIVVAYSKGVSDVMTALAAYPELAGKVAAVIGVAGVVNGSPVADQRRELYDATVGKLGYANCPVTDQGEVASLTREYRQNWLATHTLPSGPRYFSIPAVPAPDRVSRVFAPFRSDLSRIDPHNDGQVIYYDAILPRSVLLGFANADHFAVALPLAPAVPALARLAIDHNGFPRAQLVEAAVRFAASTVAEGGAQH